MFSVSGRGAQERAEGGTAREHKKTFESDGFVHYVDCSNSFMDVCACLHMPKSATLYTLNTCLLCVHFILHKAV